MIETISKTAHAVVQSIGKRQMDQHRVYNESLVNHLFVHQLLSHAPAFESRLWMGYRPWPAESNESIGYWIDADSDQESLAIEVHVDDPRNDSQHESAEVWGRIIGDVLRLATAMTHCHLGNGLIVLFGELRHREADRRISQFPVKQVGDSRLIETRNLSSDKVMDEGFFEEIMHPHEIVPAQFKLELAAANQESGMKFWIWKISPATEH